jgi:hypothetical protein
VYRLSLATRARVRLLLTTPTWDGVLALRRSCTDPPHSVASRGNSNANEPVCNNDFGDTRHAKIETTLEPGTYYVVVDGHQSRNEGTYTLEYRVLK